MNIRPVIRLNQFAIRTFSNATSKSGGSGSNQVKSTTSTTSQPLSAAGLSERCVKSKNVPVGPGASPTGEYKVPEYFCYDKTSYAEAEIEMASFRCPQPKAR